MEDRWSWYVETLLKDTYKLKSQQFGSDSLFDIAYNPRDDLTDDYYNLLTVEKEIDRLKKMGSISSIDLHIINLLSQGYTFSDVAKNLDLTYVTVSKRFSIVCWQIAFNLGDIFTNDGYFEYISDKYNLTDANKIKLYSKLFGRQHEF